MLLWPSAIEAISDRQRHAATRAARRGDVALSRSPAVAGAALGSALALKLFLWPVVVWLASIGRHERRRSASPRRRVLAAPAPAVHGIADYVRLLRDLGETFEGCRYTPYALLADLGMPNGGPAR